MAAGSPVWPTVDEWNNIIMDTTERILGDIPDGSPIWPAVREFINNVTDNMERILSDIAALLAQPVVDFDKVDDLLHQLNDCTSSVCPIKVKLGHFCPFDFDEKRRERCLMLLTNVRNGLHDMRNKFQTMVQLEEQMEALEERKSRLLLVQNNY